MYIGQCIFVIVEELKTNLMSLAILFHFLRAQHVSDINISIIRRLRMCCCASACKTGSTQNQAHQISNTQRTENKTTDVVIQQQSRKLLIMDISSSSCSWRSRHVSCSLIRNMKLVPPSLPRSSYVSSSFLVDILMSERCWAHKKWNKIASDIKLAFHSSTYKILCWEKVNFIQIWQIPSCSNFYQN